MDERSRKLKGAIQRLLDSLEDQVFVVDPNYHLLFVNEAVKRTSGYDDPVSMNLKCYQATHHLERPCELESASNHPCPISTVVSARTPLTSLHIHDGAFIEVISYPVCDEKEDIVGIVVDCHNITESRINIGILERLAFDIQYLLARIRRNNDA